MQNQFYYFPNQNKTNFKNQTFIAFGPREIQPKEINNYFQMFNSFQQSQTKQKIDGMIYKTYNKLSRLINQQNGVLPNTQGIYYLKNCGYALAFRKEQNRYDNLARNFAELSGIPLKDLEIQVKNDPYLIISEIDYEHFENIYNAVNRHFTTLYQSETYTLNFSNIKNKIKELNFSNPKMIQTIIFITACICSDTGKVVQILNISHNNLTSLEPFLFVKKYFSHLETILTEGNDDLRVDESTHEAFHKCQVSIQSSLGGFNQKLPDFSHSQQSEESQFQNMIAYKPAPQSINISSQTPISELLIQFTNSLQNNIINLEALFSPKSTMSITSELCFLNIKELSNDILCTNLDHYFYGPKQISEIHLQLFPNGFNFVLSKQQICEIAQPSGFLVVLEFVWDNIYLDLTLFICNFLITNEQLHFRKKE